MSPAPSFTIGVRTVAWCPSAEVMSRAVMSSVSVSEYSASGTAVSYTSAGDLPANGMFQLQPGPSADYATRVLVRRPTDPNAFNGTVVVEWLNVSGGVDAGPDYTYLSDELIRGGYAWVGVSAQRIGVEGGPVLVSVPGTADNLPFLGALLKREQDLQAFAETFGGGKRTRA